MPITRQRVTQMRKAPQSIGFALGSKPLRWIPLYQSSMRVSCQQFVCLLVVQWRAMHDLFLRYEPASVDAQVVGQLATRIAQVFSAPPLVDADLLRESCGWNELAVWATSTGNLTEPTDSHDMGDRCAHTAGGATTSCWRTTRWHPMALRRVLRAATRDAGQRRGQDRGQAGIAALCAAHGVHGGVVPAGCADVIRRVLGGFPQTGGTHTR